MREKKWFFTFIILLLCLLLAVGGFVAYLDPFFHYGPPKKGLYYRLYDQRSQNDGITRNFDYDAIITGTSMAENFSASRFDALFGTQCIKVCYSGATYREIDDNLERAFESGHNIRYIFRPLDYSLLIKDKDEMRIDMGEYPVWLTDKNPFNDVKYLLNKDVIVNYALPVALGAMTGKQEGHTSFDEYSYTGDENYYGKDAALQGKQSFEDPENIVEASEQDLEIVRENMEQNVVSLARQHPETTFIYFFPPYSMSYWGGIRSEGNLQRYLSCIREAADMCLECDNIHLYSFGLCGDITCDLDRYRDQAHYDPETNDEIMDEIASCEYGDDARSDEIRITNENIDRFFERFSEYLEEYDYNGLF